MIDVRLTNFALTAGRLDLTIEWGSDPQERQNVLPGHAFGGQFWGGGTVRKEVHGWRCWYTRMLDNGKLQPVVAESIDGIHWDAPIICHGLPDHFVPSSVVAWDRRYWAALRGDRDPGWRYRWQADLWSSMNGIDWALDSKNIAKRYYGEVWALYKRIGVGYGLLHRENVGNLTYTDADGNEQHEWMWRCYAHTYGGNMREFQRSDRIFAPDGLDEGKTQFYTMSVPVDIDGKEVAALGIYRPDLLAKNAPPEVRCEPYDKSFPADGVGYSVLTWGNGGDSWTRSRIPLLSPRDDDPEAFDHAYAWVTSIVPVGDKFYVYYYAAQWGHVVRCDRSLGLVIMDKDELLAGMV